MTIAAAVDIGTNSVKMTVAERAPDGGLSVLFDDTQTTRLGKNVDANGRLDDAAVQRTLDALTGYAAKARALGAERIAAAGTSALRDAANGPEFVERARQILGGTVEIVTGDREAHLTHTAARRDPDLALPADAPIAVMDIGGGSTEFVLGIGDSIRFRDSLQIGAVRLTERALHSDPPTENELKNAVQIIDAALAVVPPPSEPTIVVGSGGTIANLAAMESVTEVHGARLTREQVENRIARLWKQTIEERKTTPGLDPTRADVILAGALIQARALHRLNADAVIVSTRSLRYGLLYELLYELL